MTSEWREVRLGELCTLTKGKSATLKTSPGNYPLVVTGPVPLSSDEYQFDGEAVCIPMVSSTGHGHASLKRVHYARGKFAVANIITAAQVIDSTICDTRFLFHYLQHFKDELIVIRMQGTANVSLSQKVLAEVPILIPPMPEQRRIVDLIGALDDAIEAATDSTSVTESLRQELASHLWNEGYPLRTLKELGTTLTGSTPSTKNPLFWTVEGVPFVTPADIDRSGGPIADGERALSELGAQVHRRLAPPGSVLQVCIGGTIGKVGVAQSKSAFNQQINAVVGLDTDSGSFLGLVMSAQIFQETIRRESGKSTMPIISKGKWESLAIPWPDIEIRRTWAEVAFALSRVATGRATTRSSLVNLRSELLSAVLSGAHTIPESYDDLISA